MREKDKLMRKRIRENKRFGGNREAVLIRDKYMCVECGSLGTDGEELSVHHRDGKGRGHPNPNNDMGNLETLCARCHRRKHVKLEELRARGS